MKWIEALFRSDARPALSKARIWFALFAALVIDGLQFGLGPFGWAFVDEGLDVVGMILISWAIGFHMLLLPTFLIEFIPGPDMLPTWTGCTIAVILLRKRARQQQVPPPIDITSEVTTVSPSEPPGHSPSAGPDSCPAQNVSNQN